MKKRLTKARQLKQNDEFNLALMAFFAVAAAIAGYFLIFAKAAPPAPTVYLSPATQTYGVGNTVTVQVREDSGTTSVNAVQANFSYPTNSLTFVSISETGSPFTTSAQSTGGSGQVQIGSGIPNTNPTPPPSTGVTGDQLIATVTFTANATDGPANLAFTTGTALVEANTPNSDILGSLAATGGATLTVDDAPPTTSITAPANNATISLGGTTTITATASDTESAVTKVDIYIDGTLTTTINGTGPYSYSWNTSSPTLLGTHTIQSKATDSFNNVGSSSVINVTVADTTPPTVSLTAPAANAIVQGSTVTVSANAADNVAVTSVQFQLDGVNLGAADTTSPYTTTWNTTGATNANHTLTAIASDAAGNHTTSSSVTVLVDNAAPTVSITAPTGGASLGSSNTTTVTVTAADNTNGSGVSKVEFYVDGVLNSTDTVSPYTFSLNDSTLSIGSHSLTAKAYDKAPVPNVATSSAVSVTVIDNTPPTAPTALHTTSTTLTSIALAWTASTDNVGVTGYQVSRNGTLITTVTTPSYTDTGLAAGTNYSYSVVAIDAANNHSTAATLSASTLTALPGDINLDGHVTIADLSLLLSSYGSPGAACVTAAQFTCDINGLNGVTIIDLSILLSNYGR